MNVYFLDVISAETANIEHSYILWNSEYFGVLLAEHLSDHVRDQYTLWLVVCWSQDNCSFWERGWSDFLNARRYLHLCEIRLVERFFSNFF